MEKNKIENQLRSNLLYPMAFIFQGAESVAKLNVSILWEC